MAFDANELSVSLKNGKVYVSMQESLLFPSGSATVNPKGKEALATLAKVLNQNLDINVEVEGHTDSIPISKTYKDNWELSVARSTSITRILIKDYWCTPARIKASGRSYYDPIATNSTPEGRAQNRRTEIILEPKLDELMRLIRESSNSPIHCIPTTDRLIWASPCPRNLTFTLANATLRGDTPLYCLRIPKHILLHVLFRLSNTEYNPSGSFSRDRHS